MNVAKRITPLSKLAIEPHVTPEIQSAEQETTQAVDQESWNLKPLSENARMKTRFSRRSALNSKTSSEEGPRASRWNFVLLSWSFVLFLFLALVTVIFPRLSFPP